MTDEELAAIEARNATRREKVEGGEGCGCCRDEAADALPDIDTLIAEVRRLRGEQRRLAMVPWSYLRKKYGVAPLQDEQPSPSDKKCHTAETVTQNEPE